MATNQKFDKNVGWVYCSLEFDNAILREGDPVTVGAGFNSDKLVFQSNLKCWVACSNSAHVGELLILCTFPI